MINLANNISLKIKSEEFTINLQNKFKSPNSNRRIQEVQACNFKNKKNVTIYLAKSSVQGSSIHIHSWEGPWCKKSIQGNQRRLEKVQIWCLERMISKRIWWTLHWIEFFRRTSQVPFSVVESNPGLRECLMNYCGRQQENWNFACSKQGYAFLWLANINWKYGQIQFRCEIEISDAWDFFSTQ